MRMEDVFLNMTVYMPSFGMYDSSNFDEVNIYAAKFGEGHSFYRGKTMT